MEVKGTGPGGMRMDRGDSVEKLVQVSWGSLMKNTKHMVDSKLLSSTLDVQKFDAV